MSKNSTLYNGDREFYYVISYYDPRHT